MQPCEIKFVFDSTVLNKMMRKDYITVRIRKILSDLPEQC